MNPPSRGPANNLEDWRSGCRCLLRIRCWDLGGSTSDLPEPVRTIVAVADSAGHTLRGPGPDAVWTDFAWTDTWG